ncbi:MAG TPA: hypothetical protein VKP30_03350 [Polyangiaceae bacterium]|nr:hypothetical protein [Polyangiaceae bacterium]
MLNQMGLGFVFTARDLASNTIANLERNFMSLDRRVGLGSERIQSSFRQLGFDMGVLVLRFAPNDTRGFVLDGTGRA